MDMNHTTTKTSGLAHSAGNRLSHPEVGEEAESLLAQLREHLGHTKEKTDHAIDATRQTVKKYPWTSLGVALGAGVLLGMLIRRK